MAELITLPTFTFNQGDPYDNGESERPIQVVFYHGGVELQQKGDYKIPEKILIHEKYLKALFKEIQKHLKEASESLKK